jgi:hypothetical protein
MASLPLRIASIGSSSGMLISRLSSVPIPRPQDPALTCPRYFMMSPFELGISLLIDELDTGRAAALTCDNAAGVDEIVNEILRRPELSDCMLDILNMCYASKTVPNEWHISLLVPVFKKGNPSLCTNYHGVALMSTCAKLYNRLLLGCFRDGFDTHLRQNQNGFCPLRSTGQHVLAWRRIYDEVIATKFANLFSTFIDFSKAFDSVDWKYIENIMLFSCDILDSRGR